MIYCISWDKKMFLMGLIFGFIIKIDEMQHDILARRPDYESKDMSLILSPSTYNTILRSYSSSQHF